MEGARHRCAVPIRSLAGTGDRERIEDHVDAVRSVRVGCGRTWTKRWSATGYGHRRMVHARRLGQETHMGHSALWSACWSGVLCASCATSWASRREEIGELPAPADFLRLPQPTFAAALAELGAPARTFAIDRVAMWQLIPGDGRCVRGDEGSVDSTVPYLLVVEYGPDDSILRWSLIVWQ